MKKVHKFSFIIIIIILCVSFLLLFYDRNYDRDNEDSFLGWSFNLDADRLVFQTSFGEKIGQVNLEECGIKSFTKKQVGPIEYYLDKSEAALYVLEQDVFRIQRFTTSATVESIELPPYLHLHNRLFGLNSNQQRRNGKKYITDWYELNKLDTPGFGFCTYSPFGAPEYVNFHKGLDGLLYFILNDTFDNLYVYQVNTLQKKLIPIIEKERIPLHFHTLFIDASGIIWLQSYQDGETFEMKFDKTGTLIDKKNVKGVLKDLGKNGEIFREERDYELDDQKDFTIVRDTSGKVLEEIPRDGPTPEKYRGFHITVYDAFGEIIEVIDNEKYFRGDDDRSIYANFFDKTPYYHRIISHPAVGYWGIEKVKYPN